MGLTSFWIRLVNTASWMTRMIRATPTKRRFQRQYDDENITHLAGLLGLRDPANFVIPKTKPANNNSAMTAAI